MKNTKEKALPLQDYKNDPNVYKRKYTIEEIREILIGRPTRVKKAFEEIFKEFSSGL